MKFKKGEFVLRSEAVFVVYSGPHRTQEGYKYLIEDGACFYFVLEDSISLEPITQVLIFNEGRFVWQSLLRESVKQEAELLVEVQDRGGYYKREKGEPASIKWCEE